MKASPFVKWAGGKGQLLSQLDGTFPPRFGRYLEPFVGGGAVFFHLYNRGLLAGKEVILIDRLVELIDCYTVVRDRVDDLIAELERHEAHKFDAEYYYQVRAWDREAGYGERSGVERAARFVYLNRTCYNGLYRVNRKGQFNVPFGRHRNPKVCAPGRLRAASEALQGVTVLAADFKQCEQFAETGDLVYFDPPYHPLSRTAYFTSYTEHVFAEEEQQCLAALFRTLDRRGCRLILNNSDTPWIRTLYEGYAITELKAARPINARGDRRGQINELLITNPAGRA
ncbi:MAG: DNA adenine methylase [Halieaceae bacterium]|jgi:DNA adenine methylase|nr:DNA adenine methylase [Halieaceae bacterium]